MPDILIRDLHPQIDRALVAECLTEAQDYYHLWLGHAPGAAELDNYFTSTPPNTDAAETRRLGLFLDGHLSGLAELAFGYPAPEDAFLGLMILAPRARSAGHGAAFHARVEALARARNCPRLYLGVLQANPRGKAFWHRMGYAETGITRTDAETGHFLYRLVKPL